MLRRNLLRKPRHIGIHRLVDRNLANIHMNLHHNSTQLHPYPRMLEDCRDDSEQIGLTKFATIHRT